jgi:hypothetical protein
MCGLFSELHNTPNSSSFTNRTPYRKSIYYVYSILVNIQTVFITNIVKLVAHHNDNIYMRSSILAYYFDAPLLSLGI